MSRANLPDNWLATQLEDVGISCVLNPIHQMSEREKAAIMLRTSDAVIEREAVKLERKAAWLRSWMKEPKP